MSKFKVVVVGGGFGGVKAALNLARNSKFEVTLIHDHPDFRYYPTLYETATGKRRAMSSIPLTEIFARLPIELVQDPLKEIDRANKIAITESDKKFNYDALVLALGVKTNYFNITGLQDFSYGIKTIDDAEKLKQHLHQQIAVDKRPDLNYVVVGGGPTGIELAGALPSYIEKILKKHNLHETRVHIDLVEAAHRLLPRSPRRLSRKVKKHLQKLGIRIYLGKAVQAETVDALMVNGKPIRSHTVIWTAGMMNHPFYLAHGFQLAKNGRVRVDQFLQAEAGIYVIGDNADTPYSGMAQTAIYDGKYIASNLERLVENKPPKPYSAKLPVYVYAAGPRWSAVQWGPMKFYGWLGNILRRLADLKGFHDYEPWKLAAQKLLDEFEDESSCPVCASNLNNEEVIKNL